MEEFTLLLYKHGKSTWDLDYFSERITRQILTDYLMDDNILINLFNYL